MNDTLIIELEAACAEAVTEAESCGDRAMTENERLMFKLGFIAGTRHRVRIAQKEIGRMGKKEKA